MAIGNERLRADLRMTACPQSIATGSIACFQRDMHRQQQRVHLSVSGFGQPIACACHREQRLTAETIHLEWLTLIQNKTLLVGNWSGDRGVFGGEDKRTAETLIAADPHDCAGYQGSVSWEKPICASVFLAAC